MFQQVEEWAWWLSLIRGHQCKSVLEVGCNTGETTTTMAFMCPLGSVVRAIDYQPHAGDILKRFSNHYDCGLHIGDSRGEEAIKWAQQWAPYDAIFIDADHSYEAVKSDWEHYGAMARKLVGFHDIDNSCIGVRKLWGEIKEKHKTSAMVCPYIHPVCGERQGIGVVFLNQVEDK